jgi:hypothetical protein
MKLIYSCPHQVTDAVTLFGNLISGMCDLPHAASHALDLIPLLSDNLKQIMCNHLAQHMCEQLSQHVNYYIQYVTYPDHYTLIKWSQFTKEFLDSHKFDRSFCDLWKAHVHLLMLHAQAHWSNKWEQEQSHWFHHNDVCDLLKVKFEIWLQHVSMDLDVT